MPARRPHPPWSTCAPSPMAPLLSSSEKGLRAEPRRSDASAPSGEAGSPRDARRRGDRHLVCLASRTLPCRTSPRTPLSRRSTLTLDRRGDSYADLALRDVDPQLSALITRELIRQQRNIELIASENFTPLPVLQATGSVLTNKYAEGYPGRRYYGGCEVRGRYRGSRHRKGEGAVRGGARQRAAALRFDCEPGRVLGGPRSGRPGTGHESRPRWAPDARAPGQLLRHGLHLLPLRGRPGDRTDRHGRGPRLRAQT